MRHGVNVAAHPRFKTLHNLFEQAKKATNERIKRAVQIFAKTGKASIDDSAEVKDMCKQVVAVLHVQPIHLYTIHAIIYLRQMFADTFWCARCVLYYKPV